MNNLSVFEKNIYNIYLKTSRDKKGFTPRKDFKKLDDTKYVLLKKQDVTNTSTYSREYILILF